MELSHFRMCCKGIRSQEHKVHLAQRDIPGIWKSNYGQQRDGKMEFHPHDPGRTKHIIMWPDHCYWDITLMGYFSCMVYYFNITNLLFLFIKYFLSLKFYFPDLIVILLCSDGGGADIIQHTERKILQIF